MSSSDSEGTYNIRKAGNKQRRNYDRGDRGGKSRDFRKERDYTKDIRYTFCCEKCKYPDKPNGKSCVCVVPRSQRRVKLGDSGCRSCNCRGCTKEDRYYFEQKINGANVKDTEGTNYHKKGHQMRRKRSMVLVLS